MDLKIQKFFRIASNILCPNKITMNKTSKIFITVSSDHQFGCRYNHGSEKLEQSLWQQYTKLC